MKFLHLRLGSVVLGTALLTQPSFLAQETSGEVFPEMRALWDTAPQEPAATDDVLLKFQEAERNGRAAAEALYRCRKYVDGWLAAADPKTGLIPRNLTANRDLWNGRDAAADNYPYMVLTCALTDRPLFEGRMHEMLKTEIRLTSRLDRLGDNYSFTKQGFAREKVEVEAIIFENAEYVKDGLIPLTEWLGPSPWSERMVGLVEDIWKHAGVATPFGNIPTLNFEVNGDLLQACSRLFWFTGERKFLDWAVRLGDYFLLGTNHPTRDLAQLRLIDHGCEVLNGLSELYVAVTRAEPAKARAYKAPLHALLERVLEVGRNEHGLLYGWINPKTGEHGGGLCDTWGYDYDAFYTVFLLDGRQPYRDAVKQTLGNLFEHYKGMPWGDRSADGHADAIEGAINLFNREPVPSAAKWIDHQIRLMWAIQKTNGIIEGWHGDGNSARTSIMYSLWKSQGARIEPWRADVRLGAVRDKETLLLSLRAEKPWTGKLLLDRARHKEFMRLPLDYPRINQFPEWFTATHPRYVVQQLKRDAGKEYTRQQLLEGVPVEVPAGGELRILISRAP